MTVLKDLPQESIVLGLKRSVDFYLWKGLPVARKWPRSPGRQRAAAVEAQWADFKQVAQDWSSQEPITITAYNALVVGSQQRNFDFYMGTSYGKNITIAGAPLPPKATGEPAMNFTLFRATPDSLQTMNINQMTYLQPGPWRFHVPLDVFPCNKYRLFIIGRSNAAGQSVDCQLQYTDAPKTPLGDGSVDLNIPNNWIAYDSGTKNLINNPGGFAEMNLGVKGSNGTVDLSVTAIEVNLWFEP